MRTNRDFALILPILFCLPLLSCSAASMQQQAPISSIAPSFVTSVPEQTTTPEEKFDLSTISSACVKQFPGIQLSIDDEDSEDPIIRGYVEDVQEILR